MGNIRGNRPDKRKQAGQARKQGLSGILRRQVRGGPPGISLH
jgi:hypothetical protein